ncbi:MAG: PstS family phosphate ABC transporter substrate-binding protein [Bacteroidia bacterium]|nr:PstS family phosphate ABC transporter substrate-binding protein [Bacteroidia bacterium]MDW8088474.1 PstS family phosphate ABC transporter substrate-binding protein [Bacteroidia bacterium]
MGKWMSFFLFLLFGCTDRAVLRIKGSDTVLPLSQIFAEHFMQRRGEVLVSVTGGGSGVGLAALLNGDTEIAMASRPLKVSERLRFAARGITVIEDTVAWDVLAICVHPANPISRLTWEDLERIYTGQVRNWRELGGPDLPIHPYSRESSSGTFEFFRERVLRGKDFAAHVRFLPATGTIVQAIAQNVSAIGYIGIAYTNPNLKVLAIATAPGKPYRLPARSRQELADYPIARPLYYYYDQRNREKVKEFLAFVHSEEGRALTAKMGYVP